MNLLGLRLSFSCLFVAFLVALLQVRSSEATSDSDCKKLNASCHTCTDDFACYWCSPSKQCRKYPINSVVPSGCSKHQWFYKQCTVAGYWLIIVVPCVGIVLLISLGCCIWCCCCRTSKAKKEERYRLEDAKRNKEKDRRKASQAQRKAERQERADEIRKKYGLYQHEPSYKKLQEME